MPFYHLVQAPNNGFGIFGYRLPLPHLTQLQVDPPLSWEQVDIIMPWHQMVAQGAAGCLISAY